MSFYKGCIIWLVNQGKLLKTNHNLCKMHVKRLAMFYLIFLNVSINFFYAKYYFDCENFFLTEYEHMLFYPQ